MRRFALEEGKRAYGGSRPALRAVYEKERFTGG